MSQATDAIVPPDFLSGEAPSITRTPIDFTSRGMEEYGGNYAVILDGVLTPEECDILMKAAEATTNGVWEEALVNVGNGRQRMIKDTRSCERIMWDSEDVVARLWRRIAPSVPELEHLDKDTPPWNGRTKRDTRYRFTRYDSALPRIECLGHLKAKG